MENSGGWSKGAIILIFLKKGSPSSPMAGLEKLLLYFTLT